MIQHACIKPACTNELIATDTHNREGGQQTHRRYVERERKWEEGFLFFRTGRSGSKVIGVGKGVTTYNNKNNSSSPLPRKIPDVKRKGLCVIYAVASIL